MCKKVYLVSSAVYLEDNIPEVIVRGIFSTRTEAEKYKASLEVGSHLWSDIPQYTISERVVEDKANTTPEYKNVHAYAYRSWSGKILVRFSGTDEELHDMRYVPKDGIWYGVFKNDPDMTRDELTKIVIKQCEQCGEEE